MSKDFFDYDVLHAIIDMTPAALTVWNREAEMISVNKAALKLFGVDDQAEYVRRFFDLSPMYQPDGSVSKDKIRQILKEAFHKDKSIYFWMHCTIQGESVPTEVTVVRIPRENDYVVLSFTRDMRLDMQLQQKARQFDMQIHAILDATPLAISLWNSRYENILCNKAGQEFFQLDSMREYVERFYDLSPEFQPDGIHSKKKAIAKIKEAFVEGMAQFEWMHCNLAKEEIPSEITLVRIDNSDKNGESLVAGYTRDLRKQQEVERIEKEAALRVKIILDSMPLTCITWDMDYKFIDCNEVAVNMFGAIDKKDLEENFDLFFPTYQPDGSLSTDKKEKLFQQVIRENSCSFEWMYQTKQGEALPSEVILVKIHTNEDFIVAYSRDLRQITQTLEMNSKLKQIAYYDELTGCATRVNFMEKLKKVFQDNYDDNLALLLFDIDYFKTVNDTYGHHIGDLVLKEVCGQVVSVLPSETLFGRFGGDEFLILLEDIQKDTVELYMNQICEVIRNMELKSGEHCVKTTISIGGTFREEEDKDWEQLVKRADKALYAAKAKGRNCGVLL